MVQRRQASDRCLLAAAKVGGILANRDYPGEFLFDNLMIEANVIEAARQAGTERLLSPSVILHLSEACSLSRSVEEALLSGPLSRPMKPMLSREEIAGIKLTRSYHPIWM